MRILLDECFPKKLKRELPGHTVTMVQEMGWSGKSNGALLRLAAREFDVLVTVDQNLVRQQHLERFEIGVIELKAAGNRIEYLAPLMPQVRAALRNVSPGRSVVVSG